MAYYHWASEPVKLGRRSYPQCGHPKPNGFWFDVNGSWKQWCESVRFRLERLQYRHTVSLLDDTGILFLKSARDIDRFTRRYGRNMSGHIRPLQNPEENDAFARQYGRDLFSEIVGQFSNYIMWGEVAEKYSGIIIDPYSRSRSQKYLWYHGWNCAGGCIWNTNVIRLGRPSNQPGDLKATNRLH
ncbi:MAG: hypothetical protein P8Z37_09890 [Acidobacteriota bacterium]